MFSARSVFSAQSLATICGLALTLGASTSSALADHDGRDPGRYNNLVKKCDDDRGRGHDRGRYDDHRRDRCDDDRRSRSSVSIRFGSSWGNSCDSRWGNSWGNNWNRCDDDWRRPVVVAPCPPPVTVIKPICPPPRPVVVVDSCPPPRPVIVERPVYVEREVVVERPIYVDRPVIVERPPIPAPAVQVIDRPVYIEKPVVIEKQVPVATLPATGSYRDREAGDAYLRMGDFSNAVRVYGNYVASAGGKQDGTAVRNYGLALIASGNEPEGFKNFATGYRIEPSMIDRPIAARDLGGATGYTKLLDSAVRSAEIQRTADAWLTVAVLQHANAQQAQALDALAKARDAGLENDLMDRFVVEFNRE